MYIPTATYRIQFHSAFGFKSAEGIVSYLSDLGVSTLYASPIFKARKASAHGYDVTDTNQLNPEVGTREDFESLITTLHRQGLGWLQDFVPNHMAYDSSNHMLMDIFEKGPHSPYFEFFDVVWDHLRLNLRGKLIAPFLGRPYGEALEHGEISLELGEQGFSARYYDKVYPIRIESYAEIISFGLDRLKEQLGEEDPDYIKIAGIIHILETFDSAESDEIRNIQIRLAKDLFQEVYQKNSVVRAFLDGNVAEFNQNIDLLDSLLVQQWFLFAYWRLATKEINYQRFFSVNELISLRIEQPSVFDHIHSLVLELLESGQIDGLRIDHVDGLYDPTMYLRRLRHKAGDAFLVVEKILEMSEALPNRWPIEGTTGYEFLNYVNGLFVYADSRDAFHRIYERFAGVSDSLEELLYEKKQLIIERHMTGDLDNLAHHLKKVSTTTRDGIDLTMEGLKRAVVEFSCLFPIYRTYINSETITDRDIRYVREAIASAKEKNPEPARELAFLEKVLLLDLPKHLADEDHSLWLSFVMRFQQYTSPLMAKGLEDTTFYVYNNLISLNEVGGNPDRFSIPAEDFHAFNHQRSENYPHTINTTSTHDTKRGEDVRARINVLSEIPDEWEAQVKLWREQNLAHKTLIRGCEAPDRNREYFLYQTIVGTFPFEASEREPFVGRIKDYVIKAAREAKTYTNWLDPDTEYERALVGFTEAILTPSPSNKFLENLADFQKKVAHYGIFNSLAQTVLKITSPGLPDFYQGSELWDLTLVDPDNRRPVDFSRRREILRHIKERESSLLPLVEELLSTKEDGRVKLFTIYRALGARNLNRELFERGDYTGLKTSGKQRASVIAFARRIENRWVVIVVPRFLTSLIKRDELPLGESVWQDTRIELPAGAPGAWRDAFTDQIKESNSGLLAAEVFRHFPVSFLLGQN